MRNATIEVVLQPDTTFHSYSCGVLKTSSLDSNCVLRSARALMLGEAESYVSTNLRLLRVVYAKDPFTMLVNVTELDT
jgi:hypothetical protein